MKKSVILFLSCMFGVGNAIVVEQFFHSSFVYENCDATLVGDKDSLYMTLYNAMSESDSGSVVTVDWSPDDEWGFNTLIIVTVGAQATLHAHVKSGTCYISYSGLGNVMAFERWLIKYLKPSDFDYANLVI